VVLGCAKVSIYAAFTCQRKLFAHVLTTERIPHSNRRRLHRLGTAALSFPVVVNILLLIAETYGAVAIC
jgi:C4-dicarboxylate transporter DctM subunit